MVVNPDCNILKKFFGFNADRKTAFQNGAMNSDQSACRTSSNPNALASRTYVLAGHHSGRKYATM